MPEKLKCDLCSQPATVHLTQIVNHKIHKVDLCEECAQAKGVTDPNGFSLADLLVKANLQPESQPDELRCEHCGFTQRDFKRLGRMGCPACYDTFKPLLADILQNMHKGMVHVGKVPRKAITRKTLQNKLQRLETDLADAVKSERYEEAARFRDEISEVKQAIVPPASE